jgi:hypothetical protein
MLVVRENLRKEAGTVNQHRTMGVETIQKDTGELKIHRSRRNFLKSVKGADVKKIINHGRE